MGLQNGMASSMNDILTCTSNLVEEIQLEFAVNLELCINISYACWYSFSLQIFLLLSNPDLYVVKLILTLTKVNFKKKEKKQGTLVIAELFLFSFSINHLSYFQLPWLNYT